MVSVQDIPSISSANTLSGWAIFWFTYEVLVFTAAIFAGIMVFQVSDVPLWAMSGSAEADQPG